MVTRSGFWGGFWALFKPYWFSEEKLIARLLLLAIIGLALGMVYMNVRINQWQTLFFNTLQDKNQAEFYRQITWFAVLATCWIVMAVYSLYLTQMLQIRWRRWLTNNYLKEWLGDRTYYRMQLTGTQTNNPDQRVAEDLKIFVDETLNLSVGLLNAIVTLVSFVGVLWVLSGPLTVPMGEYQIVIPGYMVWAALLYAVAGNVLTHKIGRPLIGLNFNQQRYEADFRYSLARFRENMEGVALYHGETDELTTFNSRFKNIFSNWWNIMRRQKQLTWFTSGYGQLAVIFPFVVAAPRFFSGSIPLGGLMQTASAFGYVRESLSWFITAYTNFAIWKATVDRLVGFHLAVLEAQRQQRANAGIDRELGAAGELQLQHLQVDLPTEQLLVSDATMSLKQGQHVLIQGPSGSGKSTLFRALAGIWPFGRGRIVQPEQFDALFLPQRPYFPLGTLREAVAYPARAALFDDEQITEVLGSVGLSHLLPRLNEVANWGMQLSGGEQQRVAFARALLQRPAWLFLDEATSNLDDASQMRLYELLSQRLKGSAIISIAHRDQLAEFHPTRVHLRPTPQGTHELQVATAQPA